MSITFIKVVRFKRHNTFRFLPTIHPEANIGISSLTDLVIDCELIQKGCETRYYRDDIIKLLYETNITHMYFCVVENGY